MQQFTIDELKKQFLDIYGGDEKDLRVFSAPGRVNLIGEHTDYNGGFVFPAALTMNTTIIARKRSDNLIKLCATDLPDRVEADITRLGDYKDLKWGNYQIGVAYELEKLGYETPRLLVPIPAVILVRVVCIRLYTGERHKQSHTV